MRAEPGYLPTPRQIALACRQIQARWSPEERERRFVGDRRHHCHTYWFPPRIDTSHASSRLRNAISELTA